MSPHTPTARSPARRRWKKHERFKRWLMRKHPNEVVGESHVACGCPLYKFLKRKSPTLQAVYRTTFKFTKGGAEVEKKLPQWALYFITNLDRGNVYQTSVRASYAFRILTQLEKEYPDVFC